MENSSCKPALGRTPARLALLEKYLAQDPGNAALLADAVDLALACGALRQAGNHLQQAREHGIGGPAWTFRAARLAIGRRQLVEAEGLLAGLPSCPDVPPLVVLHDRAYVHLLQGRHDTCRALLEPQRAAFSGTLECEALQVLWLRTLHRLPCLDDAWTWIREELAGATLSPRAHGVASLIAIDREDFASARSLSVPALRADDRQLEALVACGYVALAMHRTAEALELLGRAVETSPADGRVWSALGLASLQARDLASAQQRLETALTTIPRHVGTWHALAWTHLLQGHRMAARAAFEEALQVDRNFAESHGGLGLVLALEGEKERAQYHIEAAARLDARNLTGRYARHVVNGNARDAATVHALAERLLERPGFFGGKLSDSFREAMTRRVAA